MKLSNFPILIFLSVLFGLALLLVLSAAQNTLLVNMATDCERDIDFVLEDRTRLEDPRLKSDIDTCLRSDTVANNPRINAKARSLARKP